MFEKKRNKTSGVMRLAEVVGTMLAIFCIIYFAGDIFFKQGWGGVFQLGIDMFISASTWVFIVAGIVIVFCCIIIILGRLGRRIRKTQNQFEALSWINDNMNPSPLASQHFATKQDAQEFIERLYALGATKVIVTQIYEERWRIESEGGGYANTLIVQLPEDKNKRDSIFQCYNKDQTEEWGSDFEHVKDEGQEALEFHWD